MNPAIRVTSTRLFLLPTTLRVPLKFGPETTRQVVCLRAQIEVTDNQGQTAYGWGETPLSVAWVWPSQLPFAIREQHLIAFSKLLATQITRTDLSGHPIEIGYHFQHKLLPQLLETYNQQHKDEPMPYLAALVCLSALDIAIHDSYGNLHGKDIYSLYGPDFLNSDLSNYLEAAEGSGVNFSGQYISDYLVTNAPQTLPVWHLVGGLDPLDDSELTGTEPQDGHPVTLTEWIKKDGLRCLKIKLRGNDEVWDFQRIQRVAELALPLGVTWLSADFNCTVQAPHYVNNILDRLLKEEPEAYAKLLYVEQPFAYELDDQMLDVRSVSARKPLFLDESAHDWQFVRLGRSLGWSGVALKTCKTQTGALLSLCWAKAHGMPLMVQDLTNPMLAMIPHVRLAAHAGTIQGVECNAMQFYPEASQAEAQIHPGLYHRRNGVLDLHTIRGSGFGYQLEEIQRELPQPILEVQSESP